MSNFFEGKRVLVAGGAGFVGINLLKRLLDLNADITATVHIKNPVITDKRIKYKRSDLTKMEDCKSAVENTDYVFLCAANTQGAAVIEKNPLAHVTPNIFINTQMLEAGYYAGVKKFMWLSSSTGYPPSGERPVREEEMMTGDPDDKYFCVGWMKRYTEVLCRMYSEKLKKTMTTVVLRPTNIYGEYDDFNFETSHVFAALIRKVAERHNPVEVWGTGNDMRDLIYVGDFVDAMLLAMERIDSYNPINIGYGRAYSIKEVLGMILEADNYTGASVVFNPSKPTTIPVRRIDTTRAETLLGFKAKTGIKEGISKTLKWYRENKKGTVPDLGLSPETR